MSHIPVLLSEALNGLCIKQDRIRLYFWAWRPAAILASLGEFGRLIGLTAIRLLYRSE